MSYVAVTALVSQSSGWLKVVVPLNIWYMEVAADVSHPVSGSLKLVSASSRFSKAAPAPVKSHVPTAPYVASSRLASPSHATSAS